MASNRSGPPPFPKHSSAKVFVSTDVQGTPDLKAGVKVVLSTTNGPALELVTAKAAPSVDGSGIYLDVSDLGKLGTATSEPQIRKYGYGDTWHKIRSRAGFQLGIGVVAALATAVVGVVLSVTAASTTPNVDAAAVHGVLAWTRAPLDHLATVPTPRAATLERARRGIDARITTGDDCLALLQGEQAPPATIPGVKCTAPTSSFWSAQTVGGVITALIGVLTAILGILGLTAKYGFQASPS